MKQFVYFVWGCLFLCVYLLTLAGIDLWATKLKMDWVIVSGASSLGLLIGIFVGFFVQEAEKWDHRALSSAGPAFAGAGTLAILHWAASGPTRELWFYPIGLVVGFIIGTFWDWKPE